MVMQSLTELAACVVREHFKLADVMLLPEDISNLVRRTCCYAYTLGSSGPKINLPPTAEGYTPHPCVKAAVRGHLDCLKYAHEKSGATRHWSTQVTLAAAKYGHLDCLQYAHENGCEWHPQTTLMASIGGHLDCLRYAHENGCALYEYVCSAAAKNGHADCFEYAKQHGCGPHRMKMTRWTLMAARYYCSIIWTS